MGEVLNVESTKDKADILTKVLPHASHRENIIRENFLGYLLFQGGWMRIGLLVSIPTYGLQVLDQLSNCLLTKSILRESACAMQP